MPYIRTTLIAVTATVVIFTLKIFDIVLVMTGGQFGTDVIATQFYNQYFVNRNFGLGSAIAIVLLAAVVPVIIYNLRQLQRNEPLMTGHATSRADGGILDRGGACCSSAHLAAADDRRPGLLVPHRATMCAPPAGGPSSRIANGRPSRPSSRAADLDRNGVMEFAGARGTFEELRAGVTTPDGSRVIWVGNAGSARFRSRSRRWTASTSFTLANYENVLTGKQYEVTSAQGVNETAARRRSIGRLPQQPRGDAACGAAAADDRRLCCLWLRLGPLSRTAG